MLSCEVAFFDLAHLPETLSKMEKNVLFLHLCYLIIFTSKCSIWCHSTFHMLHKKLGTNQQKSSLRCCCYFYSMFLFLLAFSLSCCKSAFQLFFMVFCLECYVFYILSLTALINLPKNQTFIISFQIVQQMSYVLSMKRYQ